VSDSSRQLPPKYGWSDLFGAVSWNCLDLLHGSNRDWPSNHTESDYFVPFRQHSLDTFGK